MSATIAGPLHFPGQVEWSGENPLMSLKETPEGPFVTLASFFRVVLSPYGRGHALVLLQSPNDADPPANVANLCISDNEKLARFLIDGFLSRFAAYKGLAGLGNVAFRTLDSVEASGDAITSYVETVRSGHLTIRLTWGALGEPFCLALPPESSATGLHHMPSVIIGSGDAHVSINGRRLPGKPVPRELFGRPMTSAMLALSETWVRARK